MKTNIFFQKRTLLYSLIGFLSVLITSCGSYQNISYYDTDGIYGNANGRAHHREIENTAPNQYRDYFNSLKNQNQPAEIFTDVDNYSSYDTPNDSIPESISNYGGWGNNPQQVTINTYSDNWGLSYGLGFGWRYPYYGYSGYGYSFGYPYYGWGYPGYNWGYLSYGWGSPYYGWNYPYYGYNNYYYNGNYSYNPSRRGSNYSNNASVNRSYTNRNVVSFILPVKART